ncbi:MAG: hypothetical protein AB7F43_08915 [Bacteriovoracia bacterium]
MDGLICLAFKALLKNRVLIFFFLILFPIASYAVPTRTEVYRNDDLGIVVFKDSAEENVYWYIPPVRLEQGNDGHMLVHKFSKDENTNYYFFVRPYMTDELLEMIANEIIDSNDNGRVYTEPHNRRQLRPIIASQIGLEIPYFKVSWLSAQSTNIQYLNKPQMLAVSMKTAETAELDFLLQTLPGIPANVVLMYSGETLDKYVKIELSHKEIYQAMRIASTGRYYFTRAEIENAISDYVSNKYIRIKAKGDYRLPEVINRVISECFTPLRRRDPVTGRTSGGSSGYFPSDSDYPDLPDLPQIPGPMGPSHPGDRLAGPLSRNLQSLGQTRFLGLEHELNLLENRSPLVGSNENADASSAGPRTIMPGVPAGGGGGNRPNGPSPESLEFSFRPELATSEKKLEFSDEKFRDESEIVRTPIYLSLASDSDRSSIAVEPIPRQDYIVQAEHSRNEPLTTSITVGENEQYIVQAVFAYQADGPSGMKFYRWPSTWPSPYDDLYYRIGDGAWINVGPRTVIRVDSFHKGVLQFYLDRQKLWEKIPDKYTKSRAGGLLSSVWQYSTTLPQFNLLITGRRYKK